MIGNGVLSVHTRDRLFYETVEIKLNKRTLDFDDSMYSTHLQRSPRTRKCGGCFPPLKKKRNRHNGGIVNSYRKIIKHGARVIAE